LSTDPDSHTLRVVSPASGQVVSVRRYATPDELDAALARARRAAIEWRELPLHRRAQYCNRAVRSLIPERDELARELTLEMGRPIRHSPSELDGTLERTLYLSRIAAESLADLVPTPKAGFDRWIRRVPLGVVLAVTPWNYPYLTTINSLVAALLAGNAVLIKPSPQVPACAERLVRCFERAGLPDGTVQLALASHEDVAGLLAREDGVDMVAFTGSVSGGYAIQSALSARAIPCSLELGGKDPAYVREDANLERAVAGIVDGALFNAGQSCCAVERVYVHERLYERFVEAAIAEVRTYRLGDPRDRETTLGPLVSEMAARRVHAQIEAARASGARALLRDGVGGPALRAAAQGAYLEPEILTGVDHGMSIMREETFGPAFGIMRVRDDAEAIALMNDSVYGLSASLWTQDRDAAAAIGERLQTGTVFMNRCDYLDPGLAWTGVKSSGRGSSLSPLGIAGFTRPQSFHFRT